MQANVVFHIDNKDKKSLLVALSNIENLLKEISIEKAKIYVVANGTSVILFKKEQTCNYIEQVKSLSNRGVHFCICHNSLNKQDIKREELLNICEVVSAGVIELIRLQNAGYAYIKP